MRKIVIAGGSGQVGSILRMHFLTAGDDVVVRTRNAAVDPGFVNWDGRSRGLGAGA